MKSGVEQWKRWKNEMKRNSYIIFVYCLVSAIAFSHHTHKHPATWLACCFSFSNVRNFEVMSIRCSIAVVNKWCVMHSVQIINESWVELSWEEEKANQTVHETSEWKQLAYKSMNRRDAYVMWINWITVTIHRFFGMHSHLDSIRKHTETNV